MRKRSQDQRDESGEESQGADQSVGRRQSPSHKEDRRPAAPVGPLTAQECYAAARELLRRGKLEEAFQCEAAAKIIEQKAREGASEEGAAR
jgi:hypothetical protein